MTSSLRARSYNFLLSASPAAFAGVAAFALCTVGCGASPSDAPEAQYPASEQPVGIDGPTPATDVAAGDPSMAPQPLPLSGEAQVQEGSVPAGGEGGGNLPPNGTVTIGGNEGDVAIGDQTPPDQYGDTDPSALTDFKPALDPYGHWVDDGTYGTVWVPASATVGTDFTPYVSGGHWAYDDDQYEWVSDYSWGWAPFHYGRWVYTGGYGWGWIPGRQYAGAWVSWRTGGPGYGYVGWAPMAPNWYWRGGRAVGLGFAARSPYVFCPTGRLFDSGFRGSIARGPQVQQIAQNTRPYVQAAPAAHGAAHPTVSGPQPQSLGINSGAVAHVSSSPAAQSQVAHAQQYSHAGTAVAAGAHAPSAAGRGAVASSGASGYGRSTSGGSGGYAGSRSLGAVAGAQQYRGVSPTPYRTPTSSYSRSTSGVTRIGGGYNGYSGGAYSASHASPSYSSPRYSTPSYHAPYVQHSSSSAVAPHYTAPQYSAPAVHTSSGGGGGFHGGGGGGGGGRSGGGGHSGGHR